MYCNTIKESPR